METNDDVKEEVAPRSTRNIGLRLAYDGTPFLGWQVQPQGPTVQSVLQDALRRVTGEEITVKGSGRTDAGVHALGQVANFHTTSRIPAASLIPALNSVLPPEIAILAAREVAPDFDAQFSAVEKFYRYRIFNNTVRSPFERLRSWHLRDRINIESMSCSACIILGKNDFSSFTASGCSARSPVRNLVECRVYQHGSEIIFDLKADGFLRHMVRNIVGTLVEVGRGRFSPDDVGRILNAKDRTAAGVAAPAHGLYLVGVTYPPDSFAAAAPGSLAVRTGKGATAPDATCPADDNSS